MQAFDPRIQRITADGKKTERVAAEEGAYGELALVSAPGPEAGLLPALVAALTCACAMWDTGDVCPFVRWRGGLDPFLSICQGSVSESAA